MGPIPVVLSCCSAAVGGWGDGDYTQEVLADFLRSFENEVGAQPRTQIGSSIWV